MAKELLPNDTEFKTWISQIKKQVRGAQIKASIAVNEEMLELYWNIGKDISERNFEKSYGSKFFEKTSFELKTEFPDAQGFSERNLRYMKRFYMFYMLYQAFYLQSQKECKNCNRSITKDLVEELTDKIYNQISVNNEITVDLNIPNQSKYGAEINKLTLDKDKIYN